MKSAYFPNSKIEKSSLSSMSTKIDDISPERTEKSRHDNAFIEFPKSRGILWDRKAVDHPRFLNSSEIMPRIFMSGSSLRPLIEKLGIESNTSSSNNNNNNNIDKLMEVCYIGDLNNDDYERLKQTSLKTAVLPNYVFNLVDKRNDKECSLTVPITKRTLRNVLDPFDPQSTAQMALNLGKTISNSRDFSLRSCMRIRATGSRHTKDDGQLKASLRFEAVVPDCSFSLTRIGMLPILSTPLSLCLLKRPNRTGPKIGFLTLNQMRKVVPLLETDHAIPAIPIVGTWISLPCDSHASSVDALVDHPLVWAACLRFISSDKIRERVCVARRTFLIAIFPSSNSNINSSIDSNSSQNHIINDNSSSSSSNKPLFFEATWLPGEHVTSSMPLSLKAMKEFMVTDFTMDVIVDEDDTHHNNSFAALGRFRALTNTDQLAAVREACKLLPTEPNVDVVHSQSNVGRMRKYGNDVAASWSPPSQSISVSGARIGASTSELPTPTPKPRSIASVPLPSVPSAPSVALRQTQQQQIQQQTRSSQIEDNSMEHTSASISASASQLLQGETESMPVSDRETESSVGRESDSASVFKSAVISLAEQFDKATVTVNDSVKSSVNSSSGVGECEREREPSLVPHVQNQTEQVPAKIILAQQMQIDGLRKEVQELRRLLLALGSGPLSPEEDARRRAHLTTSTSSINNNNKSSNNSVSAVSVSNSGMNMNHDREEESFSMQLSEAEGPSGISAVSTYAYDGEGDLMSSSNLDESNTKVSTTNNSIVGQPLQSVSNDILGTVVLVDGEARTNTPQPHMHLEVPHVPTIEELSGQNLYNAEEMKAFLDNNGSTMEFPVERPDRLVGGDGSLSALVSAPVPLPASISVDLDAAIPVTSICSSMTVEESESIMAIEAKYK